MRKKFLANLGFLSVLNILIKPFYILIIDRGVQNTVGAEEYGLYFAMFNFSFLFHILLDFGINNYNNITIAKNNEALGIHLPNLLFVKAMLAMVYLLTTFGIGWWIGLSGRHLYLLIFLAIGQIFISFNQFFRSNLAGLHLFKTDAVLSVLDKALLIVVVGGLLLFTSGVVDFKIEWFVYVQAFVFFISALIALTLVLGQMGPVSFSLKKDFVRTVLRKTYPFALLGILMSVYNRIDSVMIERMLPDGAREAGIYAASFRLLDAMSMIGFLFASLLLPIFAKMVKKGDPVKDLLGISYRMMFVISVIFGALAYVYKSEIMSALYLQADVYWAQIFGILMLSFIWIGGIYVYGSLLTAAEKMRSLNWIALCGVILNIILNYLLIPEYKALGATVATFATQFGVVALHLVVARQVFSLDINWKLIGMSLLFAVAVSAIAYTSYGLPAHWFINVTVAGVCGLAAAFLIRLINLKSFVRLIRYE